MGGPAVQFSYETWIARYPEFSGVPEALADLYFQEAGLYFANCGWTGAQPQAPLLLNMLTSHIAQLNAPLGGEPSPQTVGRISNATQGSVNVTLTLDGSTGSPSEAFFTQTKYGFAFWQATARFRRAIHRAHPTTIPQGAFPNRPYGWGGGLT